MMDEQSGSGTSAMEFAMLGARPRFAEPRHVGRPNIGDRRELMRRIDGLLDRHLLTNNGPLVEEFERAVAAVVGVRHCVATSSGTVALEIAIEAAGLRGEVITTPFTFVATAHALKWRGITPVFCDIDPSTHNIDAKQVERLVTPRTTGILGVHVWGRPCDVDALSEIADRRRLSLLFDAAHAFGSEFRGRKIGGFGRAEVFSFHATKLVNAFEGGAIVTDDDALADRARLVRNFGFSDYDQVDTLGINGKMSEVAAAMGLTSLESRDRFVAANHRNFAVYREVLEGIPGIGLIPYDDVDATARHYVVVEVDDDAGLSRDELRDVLWAENVLARRYFYPGCHRLDPYRAEHEASGRSLPETDWLAARVLTLPTGTGITPKDAVTIAGVIRRAVREAPALKRALSTRRSSACD
ncbi:aminotransferase class I/II-fold pyridoxal phosphate-dependent enzyme [Mycobacterium sp. 3519A]|uniref:aminotransferase class I/II-fold pyridoxal phosphate-dependent enzyme n=1 Tax=Mycobacterium sp. 3519A TaxID=2057184 RepID=UPI001F3DFD7B|nr:aminotransferase class I/II-fold pyridoxal phosphate-dependent enzyme [Mycobacterium sp. 3519A]